MNVNILCVSLRTNKQMVGKYEDACVQQICRKCLPKHQSKNLTHFTIKTHTS